MTTLVLSSRHSEDNQILWREAIRRDWSIVRARGIRVPEIQDAEIVIYAESLFAPTIADCFNRTLLTPPEDWLVQLPWEYTKRSIELMRLGEARVIRRPAFIKPPNDKLFEARVYRTGEELPVDFDEELSVLVSTPVEWAVEFRCFCLDGQIETVSPYLRDGKLSCLSHFESSSLEVAAVHSFTADVLAASKSSLPRACVVDIGLLQSGKWAVVEANAAWGSGLYGCNPSQALNVIREAIIQPRSENSFHESTLTQ